MEITNFQRANLLTGEIVAFFDLLLNCILIKNCKLFRGKTNRNFYWNVPQQQFIGKKGKAVFTDIIEIQDEHLKFKVLKLAVRSYHKTKFEGGNKRADSTTCQKP